MLKFTFYVTDRIIIPGVACKVSDGTYLIDSVEIQYKDSSELSCMIEQICNDTGFNFE